MREPLRFGQVNLAPAQRSSACFAAVTSIAVPTKFYELAGLVQDRTADCVEMLDRSVRKNNAVVHLKLGFLDFGSSKKVHNPLPILRMEFAKKEFRVRWVIVRLDVVYR